MERKVYEDLKVVDMERLPEFGFKCVPHWNGHNEFMWISADVEVYEDGRIDIEVCMEQVKGESLVKLYDMIKAGIVEKV